MHQSHYGTAGSFNLTHTLVNQRLAELRREAAEARLVATGRSTASIAQRRWSWLRWPAQSDRRVSFGARGPAVRRNAAGSTRQHRVPFAAILALLVMLNTGLFSGMAGVARADGGFTSTNPGLSLEAGVDSGQVTLATARFLPSINVAGAPNPTVNWGDGTVDSLTLDTNYNNPSSPCYDSSGLGNTFCRIYDHHTYQASGSYTVTVTYYTGALISYTTQTTATVAQAGTLTIQSNNTISASAGVPFSGALAVIGDSNPMETTSQLSASIDWGDGTPVDTKSGTITGGNGTFVLNASHTFAASKYYYVDVKVTNGLSTAEYVGGAVVSGGPITASGESLLLASGQAFSGIVARFSVADTNAKASSYSATINWGDGSAAGTGVIVATTSGNFVVNGAHTYASGGNYASIVTIRDTAGAKTTANVSVSVGQCPSAVETKTTYAQSVLADTPLGYWRLDNLACAVDAGPHGLNGTFTSGVTVTQSGATGDGDAAMSFDGKTGLVSLGDPAALQPAKVSVEAWVKTTAARSQVVVRKRGYGYSLMLNAGGQPVFGIDDSSATFYSVTDSAGVIDGKWHYLAGTYDGTKICLYVDGAVAGACAQAGTIHYGPDLVAIGRDGGYSGSYFSGSIDDVAIYGKALDASRVAAHFTASGAVLTLATLLHASVQPGSTESVTGTGFAAKEHVAIVQGLTPLGTVTATSQGTATFTYTVPAATRAGVYQVILTGASSHRQASAMLTVTASYVTVVLADHPLGYWRLDGQNTVVNDATGNGLNGHVSGGVTLGQPGAASDGDKAMLLNGTTGYISLGDPAALQPATVSVEAWIKSTASGSQTIVRKRGYGYDLGLTSNGLPTFSIADANAYGYAATGGIPVNDGKWHQIVGTYDGSQVCLFVDGSPAGACARAGSIHYGPDLVAIGREGGYSGGYFNGAIDDVSIFGSALSLSQVNLHFASR